MDIEERKKLRQKLLEELYDFYFKNNGSGKIFENEAEFQKDKEKYLAYKYLIEKRLVNGKSLNCGNRIECAISVCGIDFIESNHKLTEGIQGNENLIKLNTNLSKLDTNIGQLNKNLVNLGSEISNYPRKFY